MSMIHEIVSGVPRNKLPKRKGRGRSGGQGKTAGRGGKGSSARQGSPHWKPGHEGGQTPIHRRLPKRGFSNENFERRFYIVNLVDLARFEVGTMVDAQVLRDAGLIPDMKQPVKILGEGDFSTQLTVVAGWYSKNAREKILAAGGEAKNAAGQVFEFPKPKKKFIPRAEVKKPGKKAAEEASQAAAAKAPVAEAPQAPAGEAPKAE